MADEPPSDRKAVGIVSARIDHVRGGGMSGSCEEESEGNGRKSFNNALPVEGLNDSAEEGEYAHEVLSGEGF